MCIGDFNEILVQDEKEGGAMRGTNLHGIMVTRMIHSPMRDWKGYG